MDGNYGQNQNWQDPNQNQQNRNWQNPYQSQPNQNWQAPNQGQYNQNWQDPGQNQPNQNWQNPGQNQPNQNWQNQNYNPYYNGYNNGQPSNGYPNVNGYPNPNMPNQGPVGNNGYNNYANNGYNGPIVVTNAVPPKTGNLAVGSLVLGIISLIGFWAVITFILAIIGVVLGAVNNAQDNPNKGMAIAGIILNVIGFLLSIFYLIVLMEI